MNSDRSISEQKTHLTDWVQVWYTDNFFILTGFEEILSSLPSSILDHSFLYLLYSFHVLSPRAPQVNTTYFAPML